MKVIFLGCRGFHFSNSLSLYLFFFFEAVVGRTWQVWPGWYIIKPSVSSSHLSSSGWEGRRGCWPSAGQVKVKAEVWVWCSSQELSHQWDPKAWAFSLRSEPFSCWKGLSFQCSPKCSSSASHGASPLVGFQWVSNKMGWVEAILEESRAQQS